MANINIDSFIKKGKQHFICEDYIIHEDVIVPIPYIILSDGCSSSENTDIGARILCRCALNVLEEKYFSRKRIPELSSAPYWDFGYRIITKAKEVSDKLNLEKSSLDATLIIAYAFENNVFVNMYGDGNIIYKPKESNELNCIKIKFDRSAPYYLNYLVNKSRDLVYHQNQDREFITREENKYSIDTNDFYESSKKYDMSETKIFTFEYPIECLDFLCISSDGIDSFIDNKGESAYFRSIIKDFTSFKNTTGKFVKRRLNKAISEYEKFNFKHMDDISYGCFYFSKDS